MNMKLPTKIIPAKNFPAKKCSRENLSPRIYSLRKNFLQKKSTAQKNNREKTDAKILPTKYCRANKWFSHNPSSSHAFESLWLSAISAFKKKNNLEYYILENLRNSRKEF